MKTAAKVFNILTMVFSIICFVLFLILGIVFLSTGEKEGLYISGIVLLSTMVCFAPGIILPLIINKKADSVISKDRFIIWAIIDLIFINFISGVLFLACDDNEYGRNNVSYVENTYTNNTATSSATINNNINVDTVEGRLTRLLNLRLANAITEEEYKTKREEILKDL